MVSGVLPVRVSFPSLIQCLLGQLVTIPDETMLTAFANSLSTHDAAVVQAACKELDTGACDFSAQTQSGLIELASRFGSRSIPTPQSFKSLFVQISRCEFILKPAAVIASIHTGVPAQHVPFWKRLGVQGLLHIYQAMSVSAAKVLSMFDEVQPFNTNQDRVFQYLKQYIGSLNREDLEQFLRFVTGSCVCMPVKTQILFNTLSGAARRPIAHTCEPSLELSSTYGTYLEFAREFKVVVQATDSSVWSMDAM